MGAIYPWAESVPWRYPEPGTGRATYYRGQRYQIIAAVLHVMAGYGSTARSWAQNGHYGASWDFTIYRSGHIMEHLGLADGGYHAGIVQDETWELYPGGNPNFYTIGIEHEGFPGEPLAPAQAAASRALCIYLAQRFGWPMDYAHFPPHAAIDGIDRPNDFNVPALRDAHYAYLFEEVAEVPTQEQWNNLLIRLFAGSERGEISDTERLAIGEMELARARTVQSVSDVASSGVTVALQHGHGKAVYPFAQMALSAPLLLPAPRLELPVRDAYEASGLRAAERIEDDQDLSGDPDANPYSPEEPQP